MPICSIPTALGPCSLRWEETEITGFGLLSSAEASDPAPEWIQVVVDRVQRHLRSGDQDFADLPYRWSQVSTFQQRVYRAALAIKSGHTATYGDLARAIDQPPAVARAVGTALGQNPWPLLVPCHRFIAADGKMTGFSAPGGISTKLKLLALEGCELFAE